MLGLVIGHIEPGYVWAVPPSCMAMGRQRVMGAVGTDVEQECRVRHPGNWDFTL